VSDQVDFLRLEMPAHCFQIVDVVMDAMCQLGAVTDGIRAAAIAQVKEDDGALGGEMFEALYHVNCVRDNHCVRAGPEFLKGQPNAVGSHNKACAW